MAKVPGVFYSLEDFLKASTNSVLGALSVHLSELGLDSVQRQVQSWAQQVEDLKDGLSATDPVTLPRDKTWLLLEYVIPVLSRRPDCVLITQTGVTVIEFKGGTSGVETSALQQARGYARDLEDFHEASRGLDIAPIALGEFRRGISPSSGFRSGWAVNVQGLPKVIHSIEHLRAGGRTVDPYEWANARYFPVPSIVQAAVQIFQGNSVKEITRYRADPEAMERTCLAIERHVANAKESGDKVFIALTGVPGAGKTLAGLTSVSSILDDLDLEKDQAVYLSGNLPLVKVLRAALYKDKNERGEKITHTQTEALIQEMHRFVAGSLGNEKPPAARVLVFDEAQRAWTAKKNQTKFHRNVSEPEMVFEIMNRHVGWAVVVALVGAGQEIHDGEAGLEAWGEALLKNPEWHVIASSQAVEGMAGSSLFGKTSDNLFEVETPQRDIHVDSDLHLGVTIRTLESEQTSDWVNAVLIGDQKSAREKSTNLQIWLSRDIEEARCVLRNWKNEGRRVGLLASGKADRLRAIGVETPSYDFMRGISYESWFLAEDGDHRSSNQLEVALSEFEIQGLEIDCVGLIWGGNFIVEGGKLRSRRMSGENWGESDDRRETTNAYRVLMTRFRNKMVICVPRGSVDDPTRKPEEFDKVANYLLACGVRPVAEILEG